MTADLSAATGSAASTTSKAAVKASLTKLAPALGDDEVSVIEFSFNPERITVSHNYRTEGVSGTSRDEQIKNLGFIEFDISKVVIIGELTKQYCQTLLDWSCPVSTASGTGTEQSAQQVVLQFAWGTAFDYTVSLREVTIHYVRFSGETAMPTRAELHLRLYENVVKTLPGTNPTSGGAPGRSVRVLDSSDCLASLAAAAYGKPGAWRRIAQANSIDDPLRVRPGTAVYLPESWPPKQAGGRP